MKRLVVDKSRKLEINRGSIMSQNNIVESNYNKVFKEREENEKIIKKILKMGKIFKEIRSVLGADTDLIEVDFKTRKLIRTTKIKN